MAIQNANAIAVTGGSLSAVTLHNGINVHSGTLTINQNAGHGLVSYGPPTSAGYAGFFVGSGVSGGSFGLIAQAGYVRGDYAFQIRNRNADRVGMNIYGDMVAHFTHRLVIPVGIDAWAPL
jgi:hypothetical protein